MKMTQSLEEIFESDAFAEAMNELMAMRRSIDAELEAFPEEKKQWIRENVPELMDESRWAYNPEVVYETAPPFGELETLLSRIKDQITK